MAQSDVVAVRVTATGTVFARPIRLKQVYGVATTAGLLTFRDGGASGTTLLVLDTALGSFAPDIPENGILFRTDCHVTFTTHVGGVTCFGA